MECQICEKKIKGKSNLEWHRSKCSEENAVSDSDPKINSPVKKIPKKHHECELCGKNLFMGKTFGDIAWTVT